MFGEKFDLTRPEDSIQKGKINFTDLKGIKRKKNLKIRMPQVDMEGVPVQGWGLLIEGNSSPLRPSRIFQAIVKPWMTEIKTRIVLPTAELVTGWGKMVSSAVGSAVDLAWGKFFGEHGAVIRFEEV